MAKLSDPITILKGIGPAKAKLFANLNIFTLRDLICHFPRGYEDRTKLVPIEKLEPDVPACFKAMVMNTPRTSHIRKGLDITRVQIADHTGRLNVTFFNNRYVSDQLVYGREYIFYGAVSGDFIGYSMTNPVFETLDSQPVTTRRILPIYPLTAGLNNAAVLRAVRQALAICDPPAEILPAEVRQRYGIADADRAYTAIHEPATMAEAELAKKRLIFEEFFIFSAGLSLMRASRAEKKTAAYADTDLTLFYKSLPFTLTKWWDWNTNLTGGIIEQRLDASAPKTNKPIAQWYTTMTFKLPKKFFVDANYSGHTGVEVSNLKTSASHSLDMNIKKLIKDSWILQIGLQKLVRQRNNFISSNEDFTREVDVFGQGQDFNVRFGVTWNFKSGKQFRAKDVEKGADTSRM